MLESLNRSQRIVPMIANLANRAARRLGIRNQKGESSRSAFVIAWGEEMAEDAPDDEEDDAGNSSQPCVQESELGRGHFFEKTADPADESHFAGEIK